MKLYRSQILFCALLVFVGGIFAGSFFNISKTAVLVVATICILLIAVFYRRGSRLLNIKIAFAAFLTLFFLAGILRFNSVNSRRHTLSQIAQTSAELKDQAKHKIKITIYGYINDEPVSKENKQQLVFLAKQLESSPYVIATDEQVLIIAGLFPEYHYGQQLKIYGELKIPENSSGFDYRSYLAKDNIFTIMSYPEISETADVSVSFYEKLKIKVLAVIFKIKDAFEESINRSVAEPNAAFIGGILLGARSQIPQDLKDAFSRTSTSHILAVSGYNVTIIATVISWFFLFFFRRPTAFWFSVAGIALFTILTGAQASVIRAAVMGVLVLLAHRTGRLNSPRNAIVLAGAAMVMLNPQILRHDIGFQLSFAATLGLIYVSPVIEKYFAKLPDIFKARETMVMTISAQFFVLPLLLYYFQNLSLVSLPANIIVLPTIPLAMFLGFATGVAGLILPIFGQIVGYFAWLLTSIEIFIIRLLARPSWAAVSIGLKWYMVVVAYALIVWFLVWLKKRDEAADK